MDLIKSFSYDDTHFELKLNQLDRMVYVWYQTRLTKPVEESTNPVNRIKLHADVVSDSYKSTIRLVGGRGDAIGDNLAHFNLELEKELAGRDLKDKEFTFKLVDVTDSANPVDLGETTNDAKGKIVFSDLSLSKPGIYHYRVTEVPGNDEDVVYDKLEANITIQVVRETVDNQVKLVAKVAYPEDVIFNNKLVTPAKAKIAFGKELTKAGVKQDLKADQFQFVLKDRFGKVQVTVTKTVGEKENLLVAAVLLPLDTEFNNSYIPPKPLPTPPTPPTPPVTPKPAKPVQSSEKSGPQLPETGQANDTALLALGVAQKWQQSWV